MDYLENYYANYDEDGRLSSNHGQVEYLTTMKYIHKYIGCTEKKKILEAGREPEDTALRLQRKDMRWMRWSIQRIIWRL